MSYKPKDWKGFATKTLTFSNTTGTQTLFTVTGTVEVELVALCTTNCESAGACNIELGVSGDTDAMIISTDVTTLEANEIWHDASPDSNIEAASDCIRNYVITNGDDVILTLSAQVDSGVIGFECNWRPIVSGSTLVVA